MRQPALGDHVVLVRLVYPGPGRTGMPIEQRYAGFVTAIRDGGGVDIEIIETGESFADVPQRRGA